MCNSPLNANGEVRPRNFHLLVLNDSHKSLVARQKVIHQWQAQGGVLLIGYEQFRLLSMKKNPKTKRKAMAAPEVPEDGKNKHIFDGKILFLLSCLTISNIHFICRNLHSFSESRPRFGDL